MCVEQQKVTILRFCVCMCVRVFFLLLLLLLSLLLLLLLLLLETRLDDVELGQRGQRRYSGPCRALEWSAKGENGSEYALRTGHIDHTCILQT